MSFKKLYRMCALNCLGVFDSRQTCRRNKKSEAVRCSTDLNCTRQLLLRSFSNLCASEYSVGVRCLLWTSFRCFDRMRTKIPNSTECVFCNSCSVWCVLQHVVMFSLGGITSAAGNTGCLWVNDQMMFFPKNHPTSKADSFNLVAQGKDSCTKSGVGRVLHWFWELGMFLFLLSQHSAPVRKCFL